jgi:hypothetical protein
MNIFVLDNDIELCAQYHVDKHVVKMILETTQLLNNAFVKHNPMSSPIYRPTHVNHPCSIWASKTKSNFIWLNNLGLSLCKEYSYRYGKIHKCQEILERFAKKDFLLPDGELTEFAKCMPDEFKSDNVVFSYRKYYMGAKQSFASWKNRPIPEWWSVI